MCALALLSACASADERADRAASDLGRARAGALLPAYPADCRKTERTGVRAGEPLDLALLRADQALGRANARLARCGRWYDTLRDGATEASHD